MGGIVTISEGKVKVMPRCPVCGKYFRSNKALHSHQSKAHGFRTDKFQF